MITVKKICYFLAILFVLIIIDFISAKHSVLTGKILSLPHSEVIKALANNKVEFTP